MESGIERSALMDVVPMDVQLAAAAAVAAQNESDATAVLPTSPTIAELAKAAMDTDQLMNMSSDSQSSYSASLQAAHAPSSAEGNGVTLAARSDVATAAATSSAVAVSPTSSLINGASLNRNGSPVPLAGEASGLDGVGATVNASTPSSTTTGSANAVVFRSRATMEQIQQTVSLLEKQRILLQQQQLPGVAVCTAGATTASGQLTSGVPQISQAALNTNSSPASAQQQGSFLPLRAPVAMPGTYPGNASMMGNPLTAVHFGKNITVTAAGPGAGSAPSAPGAHTIPTSIPMSASQPQAGVQTMGQASTAELTAASENGMSVQGTAGGVPMLSFQQPFLMLPPMPPIDQQPVQPRVSQVNRHLLGV